MSDSGSPWGFRGQPEACPWKGGAGWSWADRAPHRGPPAPSTPRELELWTLDPPAWGWTGLLGEEWSPAV